MTAYAFDPVDLARIRPRFPVRDVDSIAARCAAVHSVNPFRNPVAMLVAWCKRADREDTDRLGESSRPQMRGAFTDAGSWDESASGYWDAPSGSPTRFVRQLVWLRRNLGLTPQQAAGYVRSFAREAMFPRVSAWEDPELVLWALVPCSTSAEQAVKDMGTGGTGVLTPDLLDPRGAEAAFTGHLSRPLSHAELEAGLEPGYHLGGSSAVVTEPEPEFVW